MRDKDTHTNNKKNYIKYESYKEAITLIRASLSNKDLLNLIAAIAIEESIISDRCQSYLYFKAPDLFYKKGKQISYVSSTTMVLNCIKYFPNYSIKINSKNDQTLSSNKLFEEAKEWLKERNNICHGFAKSKPGTPTIEIKALHKKALETTEKGFSMVKLITKWHKQQLQANKNNKK